MTKPALILLIAAGYVLGQLTWELIGLMFEWSGKLVGWMIAVAAKKVISQRQSQALSTTQRSPVVVETGSDIRDAHDV